MHAYPEDSPISSNAEAKADRPLRIALLFPPAVLPTSPPLGIASLKAWLQSVGFGERVEVRNFDLNLAYFEQAARWLSEGRLRMSLRKMERGNDCPKSGRRLTFSVEKRLRRFSIWVYTMSMRASIPDLVRSLTGFSIISRERFFSGSPVPALSRQVFRRSARAR